MNKQRILSHLLILGSGRVASMLIASVAIIVVTRYLGPFQYGELVFAQALVGILGQVNAMGMETFLIRAIAREPARASALVSAALLVRTIFAIPVPVIIALYVHFAHLNADTTVVTYVVAVGMILWSFSVVLVWTLQALERMSFVAANDVVRNVLGLIASGLIIFLHGGIVAFAASGTVIIVLLLILNLYWSKPFVQPTLHASWGDMREVVVGSLAFWAKDITVNIYASIDSVILGSIAGIRAVGFYSPPGRVFSVALFVPNVVGNATLPLLSRLGVQTGHDFARVGRKTLALLMVCCIPITVGIATFAGPIVAILFGPAFQPSVPVLVVLGFCLVPISLNSQFAQILTARDRQWSWTGVMVVGAVVNVALNVILIPVAVNSWHNGAMGAAVALLVTELLVTTYGTLVLRDVVLESSLMRATFSALVAGAAQAGIVLLVGPKGPLLVIGEVLGVSAYAVIVVALGAVPRHDIVILWKTALRRAPKAA